MKGQIDTKKIIIIIGQMDIKEPSGILCEAVRKVPGIE
jgi:hypothetical protein